MKCTTLVFLNVNVCTELWLFFLSLARANYWSILTYQLQLSASLGYVLVNEFLAQMFMQLRKDILILAAYREMRMQKKYGNMVTCG